MSLSSELVPNLTASGTYLSAVQTAAGKYVIRDLSARSALETIIPVIDDLSALTKGGVHYIGKTTTNITDGAEIGTVEIDGQSIVAKQGDMVSKANEDGKADSEFIFNGEKWYEVGSTGSLKALAFKDSAAGNWSQTTNTDDASPEVNFANATFTGNEDDITASFTGESTNIATGFSGTQATLSANVGTTDTNLIVQLSNANVTAVTGLASSDAIAGVPDLSTNTNTTTVDFGGTGISYKTDAFTRLTGFHETTTSVGTGWTGSDTTFTGSYTPEGTVTANVNCITSVTKGTLGTTPLTVDNTLKIRDTTVSVNMSVSDLTAAVGVSGTVSPDASTKATGTIIGVNSLSASGTISRPDVTFTPSSHSFLSGATVNDEVLSFVSGNALTSGSAALASDPIFTGKGCSGSLTFSGTGFEGGFTMANGSLTGNDSGEIEMYGGLTGSGLDGSVTVTGGTLSGEVSTISGNKSLTGAKFTGTSSVISTSGIPLGNLAKTEITYVDSASSDNSQVTVAGCGTIEVGPYVTSVAYCGSAPAATITLDSGKLSVTGTQTLTYKKPTTVSISYTPSGTLTTTGYTPTGTVTGKVKATGSIGGTQILTHKHGVTVSGTVTVS